MGLRKAIPKEVIFILHGDNVPYYNICKGLYGRLSVYKTEYDKCIGYLKLKHAFDLDRIINVKGRKPTFSNSKINYAIIAQLINFVVSYSMSKQLEFFGIKPSSMIGHGFGELTAACISGVFRAEDILDLYVFLNKMSLSMPSSHLLTIKGSIGDLGFLKNKKVKLFSIKGSNSFTVSGAEYNVSRLKEKLNKKRIKSYLSGSTHSFNACNIEKILGIVEERIDKIGKKIPNIPFISNSSGCWVKTEEVLDSSYWVKTLITPIQFSKGLETAIQGSNKVLLEIGPKSYALETVKELSKKEEKVKYFCIFPSANFLNIFGKSVKSFVLQKVSILIAEKLKFVLTLFKLRLIGVDISF